MKRVLYAAGLTLLILVLALGVFLFTFDANRFRPQIVELVEQQTGRDFRLGEISLTLWPSLGLDLHQAVLGNAPGFGKAPLARIERIHLKVALLPLLRRELKVDTILLDGLQLELARRADGRSNWAGLAGGKDAARAALARERKTPPAETQGKAPQAATAATAPLHIEVNGLEIRNTRIHYRDASAGTDLVLDPFELETGALVPGQPMPVRARLHLKRQPDTELDARLQGQLGLDLERQRYRIEQLRLVVGIEAPDLPGGRLESTLEARAEADLAAQTTQLDPLRLQLLGLDIRGKASARRILEQPAWQASLEVAEFNPRRVMPKAGITPPQTADDKVLGRASLGLEARGDTRSARIEPIRIVLDDTRLDGHVRLPDLAGTAVRFDLAVDDIDLDRYLPPETDSAAGKGGVPTRPVGAASGTATDDRIELPLDTLRALDVAGRFRIERLKAFRLRTQKADLKLSARNGLLRIDPLTARLYEGGIRLEASLDARGKTPKYATELRLTGVQSGPMIRDLYGDEYLSGRADMSLAVHTAGDRVSTLKRGLAGKAAVAFGEGSVNNSELAHQVNQVIALLLNQPYDPSVKHIGFTRLTASASIRNGIVDNRDLELRARKFTVRGLGTIDLPAERIDYELRLFKAGGKTYAPIRIEGPLASPGFRFDKEAWLKQRLEGKKKAVEEKAKKRLEEELGDRFKGLFGR